MKKMKLFFILYAMFCILGVSISIVYGNFSINKFSDEQMNKFSEDMVEVRKNILLDCVNECQNDLKNVAIYPLVINFYENKKDPNYSKTLEEEFQNFINNKKIEEVFLLDKNGKIILNVSLDKSYSNYINSSDYNNFYSPKTIFLENKDLEYISSHPVFNYQNVFLGNVLIVKKIQNLNGFNSEKDFFEKIFLIGENGFIYYSSDKTNESFYLSSYVENCFSKKDNLNYYESHKNIFNKKVYSKSSLLGEFPICILIEFQEDDYNEFFYEDKNIYLIFPFLLIFIVGFFLYLIIFRREEIKRK